MRNRIYVTKCMPHEQSDQCAFLDVGRILAEFYREKPAEFEREAEFDSFAFFRGLMSERIDAHVTRLAFSNIGILLESQFSLDVAKFLLEFAKDYHVFVLNGDFKVVDGCRLVWNVDEPESEIEFGQGILETLTE